jgi:hypothetical protein
MTSLKVNATASPFMVKPSMLLRLEGLTLLVGAIAAYASLGGNGWLFAALLLAPDLAMLGALADARLGVTLYNLFHTTTLYALIAALGWLVSAPLLVLLAVIGLAHIGMDRFVGYGLRYTLVGKDTHLQRL